MADLIGRTPGLRSVLGPLQKLTHLDPKERHALEREAIVRRHGREKLDIERLKRTNSRVETREKSSLEKALKHAARQARKMDNKAKQDFHDAARDQGLWRMKEFKDGEMSVEFNDTAEFVEGADKAGEEEDDRVPGWKERAEETRRGLKPRRGKGYGYRRNDD